MNNVFGLGAIKGSERASRFVPESIVSFINSLDESQLKKMKKALMAEMRLTYNKRDSQRYQALKKELEYIQYRLGK